MSKLRIYITLTIIIVINTGSLAQSDEVLLGHAKNGTRSSRFSRILVFWITNPLARSPDLGNKQAYSEAEAEELELAMQNRLDQQDAPLEPNRGT